MFGLFKKRVVDETLDEQLADLPDGRVGVLARKGESCDVLPDAEGLFGQDPGNPVPTNGLVGADVPPSG